MKCQLADGIPADIIPDISAGCFLALDDTSLSTGGLNTLLFTLYNSHLCGILIQLIRDTRTPPFKRKIHRRCKLAVHGSRGTTSPRKLNIGSQTSKDYCSSPTTPMLNIGEQKSQKLPWPYMEDINEDRSVISNLPNRGQASPADALKQCLGCRTRKSKYPKAAFTLMRREHAFPLAFLVKQFACDFTCRP